MRNALGAGRVYARKMESRDLTLGTALTLILLGVIVLEAELYPLYRSDANALMDINAVFAAVLAALAAAMGSALLTRHEVGGSAAAVVAGWILFLLLLRSGEPGYTLPPLAVFAGGLFGFLAYASRLRADGAARVSAPTSR